MKQLLSLKQDYFLEMGFRADQIKDEATGQYRNDWVDDTKTMVNGKQFIDQVILLSPQFTNDGYNSPLVQKIWIDKDDILRLAEKIKELDQMKIVSNPGADIDLPF